MIAGDHITPTIRLVRVLGRGGMGSVWVADHSGLGTQVAVKLISGFFAENQDFVRRFRCEAMAAAKIKGPNVAQVLDHGVTSGGVPFIVMELLEGEDLRRRMKREAPLNPPEVVAIVCQVAKALGRAHQLGIVHRDIKPDNIFLTDSDGELLVKVLDFGVAKVGLDDARMTVSGAILGTPRYMSPEQFLSTRNVDFRADLWSLGAVVYHALTGVPPFAGEGIGELALAVHSDPIPKARAVRPDLPEALDDWFEKAFSRDPAGRFASARQMADELGPAVRGWSPLPSIQPNATVLMATLVRSPSSSFASSSSFAGTAHTAPAAAQGPAGVRRRARTPIAIALFAIAGLAVSAAVFRVALRPSAAVPASYPSGVAATSGSSAEPPAAPTVMSPSPSPLVPPENTIPAASAMASASAPPSASSFSPPRLAGGSAPRETSHPAAHTRPSPAVTAPAAESNPPPGPAPSPAVPPATAPAPAAPAPPTPSPELPPTTDPYG